MKKNLFVGVLCAIILSSAYAFSPFVVRDIRVEGIQRTEAGTVFSYLPVRVGEMMTDEKSAQAIKALFATGFFKDVRIEIDGAVVVVVVEERPAIAQIDFVGLKEFDKDQMILGLKEAGFSISRSFDRSMLERAEQELKRQYLTRGKYSMTVTTTVTPLERNRVAINFNIDEGEPALIKQINIVGANSFKEKDLLENFQLQTPNWISWYTKNDQYSKQKLSADLETLRSFYMNRGFLEFNIESTQVSISPDKQDIYITINVSEGERYIVSSIKLAGDLTLSEEELRKAMQVKPGDVFSRESLNQSTKAISEVLSAKGYAFANVNAAPEVDKEKRRVAFTVFIDPGKRVYVRRINIGGNTKTRDEVVRQEVRQMEGAWYDDEKVNLSRQRIDKTDYFSEVTVETVPVPGTTDQVDVNYNVTEKTTGNITVGVGYSQSEKVMLSGAISQANIFGSGRFVSVELGTGKINRSIGLHYNNPYFTVDGVSQGFDVYTRKTDPTSLGYVYKTESMGGGVHFGIPISETQSITFGAAIDHTEVELSGIDPATGQPTIGNPPPLQYTKFINKFCGRNTNTCATLSIPLTIGWVNDGRDSAIDPTKGTLQRANFEFSPGGDLRYYKVNYQHQRYFPITRNVVLMLNGEVGYAKGLGGQDMPFFKNFYAGGVNSVRGYDTSSLGPYEIDWEGDEVRLGGTRRFVFNAELSMPLPGFGSDKSMRFGPFFDAGQVYADKPDLNEMRQINPNWNPSRYHDSGSIRMSVGLAASWLSPMGPLKLSFGYPLNEQKGDNIQRVQFQMGTMF